MANTISYLDNIQKALLNVRKACKSSTKVILTYHNPAWELILSVATLLKQRMPINNLNWLSYGDLENLLDLEGLEVIGRGKRMLLPNKNPPIVSVI